MKTHRGIAFWGAALVLAWLAGCGSRPGFEGDLTRLPEPDAPRDEMTDEEIERAREEEAAKRREILQEEMQLYIESEEEIELRPEPTEYQLVIGDEFSARFVNQPSMNVDLIVRPDGNASFDLLGDLPVAGLTPRELARNLEELYSVYLRDPMVNVVVRNFENQRVFVLGMVESPGEHTLKQPLTLTQAIAKAGSWKDGARLEDVMVIRMRPDRTPFAFKVNVKEIIREAPFADPFLANMDIVYVPKSRVTSLRDFSNRFFGIIIPPIDAVWKTAIIAGYKR